jgi:hypothetical protein
MCRALLLVLGIFIGIVLAACGTAGRTSTPTLPAPTATPSPSLAFPTLPPTPTLTPPPSLTPTPDIHTILGARLFHDDFTQNEDWDLGSDTLGASSVEAGRLVLALHQAPAFRYVLVPGVTAQDFYLEVTIRTELCHPNDESGVLIRFTPEGEYYRIGLYCDGRARITRVLQSSTIALVPPTPSPLIIPGAPAENVLAVLAVGDTFHLFVNGFDAFSARDRSLSSGRVGLFARSSRSAQLTVSFDNLDIFALLPTPTPTPRRSP